MNTTNKQPVDAAQTYSGIVPDHVVVRKYRPLENQTILIAVAIDQSGVRLVTKEPIPSKDGILNGNGQLFTSQRIKVVHHDGNFRSCEILRKNNI